MILFPAIDMLGGECVRLLHGKKSEVTRYGSPIDMAHQWQSLGAEHLHLVDLNGAFDGLEANLATVKQIVREIKIPVQLGGGIRTLDDIKVRLDMGVERVILGTACYRNPEIVEAACALYPNRIVTGIDCKDGLVAIRGWVETVNMTAVELGTKMKNMGINTVVYTDISRDGALTGVNSAACKLLAEQTGLDVIASGGVSTLSDITDLLAMDMYGVILGKSLYSGSIELTEALKISQRK